LHVVRAGAQLRFACKLKPYLQIRSSSQTVHFIIYHYRHSRSVCWPPCSHLELLGWSTSELQPWAGMSMNGSSLFKGSGQLRTRGTICSARKPSWESCMITQDSHCTYAHLGLHEPELGCHKHGYQESQRKRGRACKRCHHGGWWRDCFPHGDQQASTSSDP